MAITDLLPWSRGSRLPVRGSDSKNLPAEPFDQMYRMMDEIMENPFSPSLFPSMGSSLEGFYPQVDVSENEKEVKVTAEIPGMDEKDIQVALSDNVLSLSGYKETEKEEKGKHMHRIERSSGSFHRDIPLPAEVDEEQTEAIFKNGVLTITLPKVNPAQIRGKRITVRKV